MKKIKEKFSILLTKNPGKFVILFIVALNFLLVFGAAGILVLSFKDVTSGFWETVYYVFLMILDAGNIDKIADPNHLDAGVAIICIVIIFIGTLIFTGAIIGYLTNYISGFIDSANSGNRRLKISDHIVIINWNNRAIEIINDLLFSDTNEKVVVLVNNNREEIEEEINNRLSDTIERTQKALALQADELIAKGAIKKSEKKSYIRNNFNIKKVTVIVKQGETYSLKQLNDISLLTAKTVIILGNDKNTSICKYDTEEIKEQNERGNINIIKNLVQVSQITTSAESANNQKVVVEVDDDWTLSLVNKIINHKVHFEGKENKCNIVPIPVNQILGQILSQFSIMPELNMVYSDLFSNKGSTFYSKHSNNDKDEITYISDYLKNHELAIPVTVMDTESGKEVFYVANEEVEFNVESKAKIEPLNVKLANEYQFEKRHIAIIGHNSKYIDILDGFNAFLKEWGHEDENLIEIMVIDDKKHLEKYNYFSDKNDYPCIKQVVEADVYDQNIIQDSLKQYISSHPEDTSILILSDDNVAERDIDSNALTFLVYVQDIVLEYKDKDPLFDEEQIDVIVELLNPKNYDVASSYSSNNVIISNRYISRMVAQVGEKEAIYDFYKDILTYDTGDSLDNYESKELYIKVAERLFDSNTVFPIKTNPRALIQGVFKQSPDNNKSVVLGYVKHGTKGVLFTDMKNEDIIIEAKDKLIIFAPH